MAQKCSASWNKNMGTSGTKKIASWNKNFAPWNKNVRLLEQKNLPPGTKMSAERNKSWNKSRNKSWNKSRNIPWGKNARKTEKASFAWRVAQKCLPLLSADGGVADGVPALLFRTCWLFAPCLGSVAPVPKYPTCLLCFALLCLGHSTENCYTMRKERKGKTSDPRTGGKVAS